MWSCACVNSPGVRLIPAPYKDQASFGAHICRVYESLHVDSPNSSCVRYILRSSSLLSNSCSDIRYGASGTARSVAIASTSRFASRSAASRSARARARAWHRCPNTSGSWQVHLLIVLMLPQEQMRVQMVLEQMLLQIEQMHEQMLLPGEQMLMQKPRRWGHRGFCFHLPPIQARGLCSPAPLARPRNPGHNPWRGLPPGLSWTPGRAQRSAPASGSS